MDLRFGYLVRASPSINRFRLEIRTYLSTQNSYIIYDVVGTQIGTYIPL